jgi:uncharacterized protein
MHVVSNTSPISNLAIIGRLELLKRRYGQVRIPPAVAQELSSLSHPDAKSSIAAALADGWLAVDITPFPLPESVSALDAGEKEAIGLALVTRADVLLVDEKRGRQAARRTGLAVG